MTTLSHYLQPGACLPSDEPRAALVGRLWVAGEGAVLVHVTAHAITDISNVAPTMSQLLELPDPAALVRVCGPTRQWDTAEVLSNTACDTRHPDRPWLMAPCDLQAIKASGVTFVSSMLERVIEEQARGDASRAEAIRQSVTAVIGENLSAVRPGSPEAARLKALLIEQGMWSQYLEVGIGPDAEIFTKSQPMSAVGTGADVGIHPGSEWNNPEPEVVLAVDSRGEIKGATLGNDVNLRDFEGRSALLLGKAKDNNGSCAVGPFIRLFDDAFGMDDVKRSEIRVTVQGPGGYELRGGSSLSKISRAPQDLVAQAIGANHQYPDGLVLFLGTMFAPTQDRHQPGQGFTHVAGDIVAVSSEKLGTLANRVGTSDSIEPWTYGAVALMRDLARRGLLA